MVPGEGPLVTDPLLAPDVAAFVDRVDGQRTAVQERMEALADREKFPTVGPSVGRLLRLLTGLAGANRVFECGSGFGYSAYWFAQGVGPDGEVVLTETNADRLEQARIFLTEAGLAGRATFEHGDALSTLVADEGPIDVAFLDHEKSRYAEAFERIRPRLSPGGLAIADNAMTADVIDFPALAAHVAGEDPDLDEPTAGIARYLETVCEDPNFQTVIVPLGEGVALTRHVGDSKG